MVFLLLYGPLITPQNPRHARYLTQALICVNDGVIQWIEEKVELADLSNVLLSHELEPDVNVIKLRHGQFLMPGFIDTHTVCFFIVVSWPMPRIAEIHSTSMLLSAPT